MINHYLLSSSPLVECSQPTLSNTT